MWDSATTGSTPPGYTGQQVADLAATTAAHFNENPTTPKWNPRSDSRFRTALGLKAICNGLRLRKLEIAKWDQTVQIIGKRWGPGKRYGLAARGPSLTEWKDITDSTIDEQNFYGGYVALNVGSEPFGLNPFVEGTRLLVKREDESTFKFFYKVRARPHGLAELGAFPARNSRFIWHVVDGAIKCVAGKPTVLIKDFTGSAFPTHRLWINDEEFMTLPQGPISQLLVSDPDKAKEVIPRP